MVRAQRKGGFTLPDALAASDVTIYLRPDCYDPNSTETFLLIAHELVHAQQIQNMGFGVGLAHPFIASYLGCALANGDFSGSRRNPYEAEAYAYANGSHARLRQFPGAVKGAADTSTAPCLTKTAGAIGSATASMIGALGGWPHRLARRWADRRTCWGGRWWGGRVGPRTFLGRHRFDRVLSPERGAEGSYDRVLSPERRREGPSKGARTADAGGAVS